MDKSAFSEFLLFMNRADKATVSCFIAWNTLNSTIPQVLPTLKNIPPTRTGLTPRRLLFLSSFFYSSPFFLDMNISAQASRGEEMFWLSNEENTRLFLNSVTEESCVWMWQGLWIAAEPGNSLTLQCFFNDIPFKVQ